MRMLDEIRAALIATPVALRRDAEAALRCGEPALAAALLEGHLRRVDGTRLSDWTSEPER